MAQRLREYSVGDLARLAGVSVRTLHHYDEIELLRPRHVGAKGYRSYGQDEAERLQEILFYREVGMALADIARLLDSGGGRLARLEAHRARLREEQERLGQSLVTLEATIAALKENRVMEAQDLYKPFSAEKQAAYEDAKLHIEDRAFQFGESIYEVTIGEWLVAEGEYVERDANVVALETDKASMELPAPAAGTEGARWA